MTLITIQFPSFYFVNAHEMAADSSHKAAHMVVFSDGSAKIEDERGFEELIRPFMVWREQYSLDMRLDTYLEKMFGVKAQIITMPSSLPK